MTIALANPFNKQLIGHRLHHSFVTLVMDDYCTRPLPVSTRMSLPIIGLGGDGGFGGVNGISSKSWTAL